MTETNTRRAVIYTRLEQDSELADMQFTFQVNQAQQQAIDLGSPASEAYFEVGPGSALKDRPILRELLEQARNGQVSHISVMDLTCLLCGAAVTDWWWMSNAFVTGGVVLLADDQIYDFRDSDTPDLFLLIAEDMQSLNPRHRPPEVALS